MKTLIGLLAVLISLAFIGVLVLRIWDIQVVSLQTVIKSSITLVILGITAVLLLLIYGGFFSNNDSGYNKDSGDRAHPKL